MPTSLDRMIGLRLQDIREQRKLSRAELGGRLDVSVRTVQHWEHGRVALTGAQIERLAAALQVTPAALRMMPGKAVTRR